MIFIIDLDDYLLKYEDKEYKDLFDKYENAIPDKTEIDEVNKLFNNGNIIIIHTGRNWDKYNFTKSQLHKHNVKYHELVMGKPQGYYIDPYSYKNIKECLSAI